MSCMQSVRIQKRGFGQAHQHATIKHTASEIFPDATKDAAAIGYVLSRLTRSSAPILWVQDRLSRKETGQPYLASIGIIRPIITVDLSRAADVLWALEDGLRCRALAAVIGEVWGDPAALDFTATKRLAMRSEAANVPCWLIRHAATPNLSAARDRWRIASLPSAPNPYDAEAPGNPRWSLDLFRSRGSQPGKWTVAYDRQADRLDHVAPLRDGTVGADHGTSGQRAIG
ncbi:hypothetical protein ROLI_047340 (plasmid) [Roseobacter fucihabitans]|uniref:Protein ImuA n=1 Tax=Roseobacter fucihabitans TaxID=1537242 RepID=A0ABZ2C0F2_9RHOB|nr:hypothetical protein [Roseobacter litoralis]